ncbi:MAG: substrate-binding domain-containing protein [Spirochaetaceae bacterium]|nr:substrate-binding domain-containing protein [Spirochaetaceae bacterium]
MKNSTTKIISFIFILMLFFIATLVVFSVNILNKQDRFAVLPAEGHKNHILVAGTHTDADFLQEVYEGASSVAEEYDAVVELLLPDSHADDVSISSWLEYAEYVGASGIIAYVDDEKEIVSSPVDVYGEKIPLVTLGNDNPNSSHISYIGTNKYELGRQLAKLVKSIKPENAELLIVTDTNHNSEATNIMLAAFSESLGASANLSWNILETGRNRNISSDEIIRQTFIKNPKINMVICLSLEDTLRVTQSVIDLNRTGQIKIIGFHESAKTLEYLSKGILSAIISFAPEEVGIKAMKEIFDYKQNGYANGYIVNDINVITKETLVWRERTK